MERRTFQAIEAKAAQIRRPFRINPDLFVRWGLIGGMLTGAIVLVVLSITGEFRLGTVWDTLLGGLSGGAIAGATLGGLAGFFVSLLYEAFLAVADFIERMFKPRVASVNNEDVRLEE